MNNKGFTLLEIMVVILLITFLTTALGGLLVTGVQTFTNFKNQIELQQNLRFALYNLTTEIRKARQILEINEKMIKIKTRNNETFTYELDKDPQATEHLYQISGNNLYRFSPNSKAPIANFIDKIIFKPKEGYQNLEDITYIDITILGFMPSGKKIELNSGVQLKWKSFGSFVKEG
ncbi:prepilin-type N-terminal cleavage/methylation domain-containing protein [Desulfonispora thiosulfatigenes DSM 11270]|uniref:Prepilin-type N-terminal cleavage/methylation domain-containing protein n=1 Tax=Desulfonispora thiosulfatigenes DSM 11270 TaxID=656914 RepID=A0A1W1VMW9_DESTI|nr:prepilin-type N-terminal cleavage/methylation domain-containing protein [Desulfonispora thiosulfatigenes]SMB94735.1 prepilin-type N-terminal cleavage/methylation domain-containing protein [Desulfonispora thiosulfatigenes DSM 11270]